MQQEKKVLENFPKFISQKRYTELLSEDENIIYENRYDLNYY